MAVIVDFSKEIIFSSSDPAVSRRITKAEKDGKLKKLAPRIYSTNLRDSEKNIIKRNLIEIVPDFKCLNYI